LVCKGVFIGVAEEGRGEEVSVASSNLEGMKKISQRQEGAARMLRKQRERVHEVSWV